MIGRLFLFLLWSVLGMVFSYAALYAFTPFGTALTTFVLVAGLLLSWIGGRAWPEALGLAAGLGAFCLLIAATSDVDAAAFAAVGATIIGAASAAYLLVGRARCAQSS